MRLRILAFLLLIAAPAAAQVTNPPMRVVNDAGSGNVNLRYRLHLIGCTVADDPTNHWTAATCFGSPSTTNGIGTAQTSGLTLQNTTVAADAAQQFSPGIELSGQGWSTGGSTSTAVKWMLQSRPVEGSTATGDLVFYEKIGAGSYAEQLKISNNGTFLDIEGPSADVKYGSGGVGIRFGGLSNTGFFQFGGSTYYQWSSVSYAPSVGGLDLGQSNLPWHTTWSNTYATVPGSVLSVTSNAISPTNGVHHVGSGLIKTINLPATSFTGTIVLIPDAAFTYDATGNMVVPSGGGTAVVNKAMSVTYDGTKWTPSY